MAYLDIHNLRYGAPNLRKKVSVAITDAAIDVLNEDPNYPNHASRVKWANESLADTEAMTEKVMWGVVQDSAVQSGGDNTADVDVQTAVDTLIDTISQTYKITVDISEYESFKQQLISANYKGPKELLIYYGYPNSFNSGKNGWSNEAVSKDMAKYDMVILGDGVQDPSHPDYANTQIIIPRLKELNPNCLIFGYVSADQLIADFQTKASQWDTLQIHGIFLDEAGYDFGVTRAAFNEKVAYVHGRDYATVAFANSWNTDHIIGIEDDVSYPNTSFNPDLLESRLTEDDWILLESFAVNTTSYSGNDGFEPGSQWYTRGNKASGLKETYGVNFAACGIINNDNANAQKLYNFGFVSSLMWSLGSWGTSDTSYGSNATVNKWLRPETSFFKNLWSLSPAVKVDSGDADVYHRYTEDAHFSLDFSSGAQIYTIRNLGVPCNLYSFGSQVSVTGSGFLTLRSMVLPESTMANGRVLRLQAGIRRTSGSGNGTYQIKIGGVVLATTSALSTTPVVIDSKIFISSTNIYCYLGDGSTYVYDTDNSIAANKDQTLVLEVDLSSDSDTFICDWTTLEILS